jgi:macrolide-specific efflux system membrane fusion protein
MKRTIPILAAILVLVGCGAATWWTMAASEPEALPNTTPVARGNVQETVLATGVLEASRLVSVGAEVSGRVEAMHVTLGNEVVAGDLIAEIDSLAQENAVKSAEAALANIVAQKAAQEAVLAQAEKALVRAGQMRSNSLVSESDHEIAQADVASAKAQLAALDAQIEQATINVESAELDLSHTTITSPITGTVVAVLVEEGQTVSAAQTVPTIVKIANLDSMLIKAEISEADVTRVKPGQEVSFSILGEPGTEIEATLRSIEPAPAALAESDSTSDSSTAIYYNGIFEVPNPDRKLRISMTAEVTIILDVARDVLVVPSSVLATRPDGRQAVGVLDPQTRTVTRRPVTVGLNNKVSAEIVEGLAEGDLVVMGTPPTLASASADAGRPPQGPGGMMLGGGMPMRF